MTSSVQSIFASIDDTLRKHESEKASRLPRAATLGDSGTHPLESAVVRLPTADPARLTGSLNLIRDVAARVKEIQEDARNAVDEARQFVDGAGQELRAAEARERDALLAAQTATARLKDAEEMIELLQQKLAEAEGRATTAESHIAESHRYLAALYKNLMATGSA